MLDGNDKETFYSLRLLRDTIDRRQKPLIFWLGAGASKWCGYPSWQETAKDLAANFRKYERDFDNVAALQALQEEKFPEVFQMCQSINPQRYRQRLGSLFGSRAPTPVYRRFLDLISQIAPLQIVTTNVDETLERNLTLTDTVQRSDLERCLDLTGSDRSFIAKLHGSISSVDSTVFTTGEYEHLLEDSGYVTTLEHLFIQATVVFLEYGIRDEYVLNLFAKINNSRPLFGDGPHFVVRPTGSSDLPASIKTIRYVPEPYSDHRSALIALDIIRTVRNGGHLWFAPQNEATQEERKLASAYFLSDVVPPGAWTNSQSIQLKRTEPDSSNFTPNAILGVGFIDSEIPDSNSSALHDLIVGLVCFDHVYAPLSCVSRLHDLLGSALFWDLVKTGVFRFIYFEYEPAMMFTSIDAISGGDLGELRLSNSDGSPLTAEQQARGQIRSVPGYEAEVEKLYDILKACVHVFDRTRFNVPNLTRGALLHPSVRTLLGISDGVFPTGLPRWVTFPVLRLASTITAGCACEDLSLPATKIGFGSEILVGAAFSVSAARDWADDVSSYVLTSRFNTDLAVYAQSNLSIFTAVLRFRDTQPGVDIRREVLEQLATNAGGEFVASVNAGLRRIVPTVVMENARDQLSALLLRSARDSRIVPAVWTNVRNADSTARLWRRRSRKELGEYCRSRGIKDSSLCPCGSGDSLRSCCLLALRDSAT